MNTVHEKATFAAGCFWGVEKVFSSLDGVTATRAGYAGGTVKDPTYEEVCSGATGHAEAIEVVFDPSRISYEDLLEVFFTHHDPTTPDRQGADVGTQYRSVIFYHSPAQRRAAERAKRYLGRSGIFQSPLVTEIRPAGDFYEAEAYHQKYLEKNPNGYCSIQRQPAKVAEVLRVVRERKVVP